MISRSRMTSAGNDVEPGDLRHRVRLAAGDQHDQHRADHDLVGDRVEELAEPRNLPLGARQIAVEIIGDADDAVEDEGDRIIERRRPPQQEDQDRHREDPRQRQQVGQRQHRSGLSRYSVWRHAQSWLCLTPSIHGSPSAPALIQNVTHLLRARRFLPLFSTQFLGAFNDSLFKQAVVLFVTYQLYSNPAKEFQFSAIAQALFILPFFLFSALSGQLADDHDKARLIRIIKLAEIGIMIVGGAGLMLANIPLMLAAVFAMGVHSTFFGPIKYAILPQHLRKDEVLGGTGLVEAGTYIAILVGTILAGIAGDRAVGRGGGDHRLRRARLPRRPAGPAGPAGRRADPVQLAHHPRLDRAGQRDACTSAGCSSRSCRSASSGRSARC